MTTMRGRLSGQCWDRRHIRNMLVNPTSRPYVGGGLKVGDLNDSTPVCWC